MSEKPHDPTPGRLARARKEGDVPKSVELSACVAFACGFGATCITITPIGALAGVALRDAASLQTSIVVLAQLCAWTAVPLVAACCSGVLATFAQTRNVRFAMPAPKFSVLNPLEGLRRIFSRESIVAAFRALVALGIGAVVVIGALSAVLGAGWGAQSAVSIAATTWRAVLLCGFMLAAAGIVFGAVDFGMATMRWRKKLRMSFDEVRRDHKEQEGDPAARARRRSMHKEVSRGSIRALKEAAFVVVNPTHIAIACAYAPPRVGVPKVLIRAAEDFALRVKSEALARNIPVIENVALARELYAIARPGKNIPKSLYVAVAEVVGALIRSGALAS